MTIPKSEKFTIEVSRWVVAGTGLDGRLRKVGRVQAKLAPTDVGFIGLLLQAIG